MESRSISNNKFIHFVAKRGLETLSKAIQNLSHSLDESFVILVQKIYQNKGKIIFTGIGKSGLIAQKIVGTLNSIGIPSVWLHATEALHGDIGRVHKGDIVICISKSGNTLEIKTLVRHLKHFEVYTVGWTSDSKSYLAQNVDLLVPTPIENEASRDRLVPTTSTMVQLALGDALAISLIELKEFDSEDLAIYHPSGQIGKRLSLNIGELAQQNPKTFVKSSSSVKEVIVEISSKRLGATVVMEKAKVTGIITDGDIRRMIERNKSIDSIRASDIMTSNPVQMDQSTLAVDAMRKMKEEKINQLIVLNHLGEYIGLVHLMDFIKEGL